MRSKIERFLPFYLALLGFWILLGPRTAAAQDISVCSAAGNTTCTEAGNRVCLRNTTSGEEECGNCAFEYIEFEEECLFIDDIDFNLVIQIIDTYAPQFTANATDEERVQRLKLLTQVVSFFSSRVPPFQFQLGLNRFSLDVEEEQAQLLGTFVDASAADTFPRFEGRRARRSLQDEPLPLEVDWAAAGAMTPVKDQGRCGCCWAVSTVAAVESAAYLSNSSGFSQSLSFQQLISCDTDNLGCNGGNVIYAMDYAWRNTDFGIPGQIGGVATLNDYPYTDSGGTGTDTCEAANYNATVFLKQPKIVMTADDDMTFEERRDRMKLAVSFQPVPVVMKSGCFVFSSYKGGVLTDDDECFCNSVSCIDHAVVMTGYNDNAATPYWLLRNSWGSSWGEDGYFRVAQTGGGRFGLFAVLAEATIPLEAYNTTAADPDVVDDNLETWKIIVIVIAGVILLCGCFGIVYKLLC